MKRAKEIELLSQVLELVEGKQPFVTDDETLIPVAHYVDEAMFEQERDLIRSSMNIVAHGSQIETPSRASSRTTCRRSNSWVTT
jgi:hypothetical protein